MPEALLLKYVDAFADNLQNRFQQKEIIKCMEVQVPKNLTSQESLVEVWGGRSWSVSNKLQYASNNSIDVDQCNS